MRVVILGGGTAGWMTATAMAKLSMGSIPITLVESDEIGIVGVGEATIPMIQLYNQAVGLDENEFLRVTQGTMKLGIEFVNWGRIGDRYMHAFGRYGKDMGMLPFDQYWQRGYQAGWAEDLAAYSINRQAALAAKFSRADPAMPGSPMSEIAHAFHFDASLYARYLRKLAEGMGVQRVEGKVSNVDLDGFSGHVKTLHLNGGRRVDGDLFVDCTGFRALLIEDVLKTGYEDWSHWLMCDTAVTQSCTGVTPLLPYTRATAHSAGWQWRIPLQHRIGNGHVFSSQYMSDDEATAILHANLDGEHVGEPRTVRFKAGMRSRAWNRNVVAIGLSSGFLEPLESTSIHLIQSTVAKLMTFLPQGAIQQADVDEFNRQVRFEFERVRDFIILHYHLTQRDDSPFWNRCRTMPVPETLTRKIDLYRSRGRLFRECNELFSEVAWLQVLHGQGMRATGYHPLVDAHSAADVEELLGNVKGVIDKCVAVMPDHAAFIEEHCKAN